MFARNYRAHLFWEIAEVFLKNETIHLWPIKKKNQHQHQQIGSGLRASDRVGKAVEVAV